MISSVSPAEVAQAALRYTRKGWPVFPCQGKKPLTPHGFKDASTDPDQIRRWWDWWPDAGIGLPTGESSGVLVLDVDFPRGGLPSLSALSQQVGRLPRTCVSRTGCGWHLFYQMPAEPVSSTTNLGGESVYPGIDLKAEGGYVIVPPSRHELTGRSYAWLGTSPLLPCPPSLVHLLSLDHKDTAALDSPPTPSSCTSHPRQASRAFLWAVAHAREGSRNHVGFWLACRLVEAGVSEAEASRLMRAYAWQVGSDGLHPYTEQEALRSLESARR